MILYLINKWVIITTQKKQSQFFYLLSIILNIIAITSSSLMSLFIFLSMGTSMLALGAKKDKKSKKAK